MTRRHGLAAALLGGAMLSGCGGSDGGSASRDAAPAITTAVPNGQLAWVQDANTICRDNNATGERINADFLEHVNAVKARASAGEQVSDADLRAAKPQALMTSILSAERKFLVRLRAVDVPAAEHARWNTFIDRIGDALDLLPQLLAESLQTTPGDPALAREVLDIVRDTRPYAQEHGLTDCLPPMGKQG
jgi:hypothetical protein